LHSNYVLRFTGVAALLALASVLIFLCADSIHAGTDPWTADQTVEPAALVKELENPKTAPMVIFVGFGRLYSAGHIKGAQFHGTTGREDGLKEFTAWVSSLSRASNLVIYCGCCPMDHCPNIRPAFATLRDLGFHKVRVLLLPNDFATDWAGKGLPYDKGN